MKTYNYRIIGTPIIEYTNFATLKDLRIHILGFFGECRIEYFGKTSGETNVK